MPPPGGYKPISFKRVPAVSYFGGKFHPFYTVALLHNRPSFNNIFWYVVYWFYRLCNPGWIHWNDSRSSLPILSQCKISDPSQTGNAGSSTGNLSNVACRKRPRISEAIKNKQGRRKGTDEECPWLEGGHLVWWAYLPSCQPWWLPTTQNARVLCTFWV